MKTLILLFVVVSITSIASAATTHCTSQEKVIFSCTSGKKIISVCASKDLSKTKGYMQYRFGKKDTIEINIPDKIRVHPSKTTNGNSLMFSGGGGAYLRFINGQYGYVIYSGFGKGWEKVGLAVEKNEKVITDLVCNSGITSELGSDLFEKSGIPEDIKGFDIP